MKLNTVHCGDCVEVMRREIPDESIDLVITSPPYDAVRTYGKDWSLDLHAVGVEIGRVFKDGGICVMVIQDQTKGGRKTLTTFRTIVDWVESTPMDLWECCVYHRHGKPGAWWNQRFRVDHEYIPIFIKGKRPQYFNKEHMKVPAKHAGEKWSGTQRHTSGKITPIAERIQNALKCVGTVMSYATSNTEGDKRKLLHPATFPDKLAEDWIRCFTEPGMVVLDPFVGSGTSCIQAAKLGRNYIGIDVNPMYVDLAVERLEAVSG